jgi:outer membrane protein TolC
VGLSASQTVFSGGRLWAQNRAASATVRTAEIALNSARAALVLDIARAYYDAALADRLVEIAEATLEQAETTLQQVRVGLQVGEQPEFELLRAQVERDTQEPVVIERRSARDIARLRLRQLLDLPLEGPIALTTELEDVESDAALRVATELLDVVPDTSVAARAPVRQAEQAVVAQEAQVSVARSQRWPSLSLTTNWARVNYPESTFPQSWNRFRTNWSVSASVSVPIFTGGRISGEVMAARAAAEEARARLTLTRELAALDTRSTIERLRSAEATWRASTGTVGQADRAFEIAGIRFREGLSTQLELSDSRILLQRAQANRAQAARDLLVARLRVALLPLLPLDTGGAPSGDAAADLQSVQPQTGAGTRAGAQQTGQQGTGRSVPTTGTGAR